MLRVFSEDESVITAIVAILKGCVNLMECVVRHIVEIVVPSRVNHSELCVYDLFIYGDCIGNHENLIKIKG